MKPVTIYTSNGCEYCHEAKEFLDQNNIPYTEHNISKDKEARTYLMKKGYMSVPVIIVGDQEMVGFDRNGLSALLDK